MGPEGPSSLNDLAINNALDNYFKVRKRDKLELSMAVRKFGLLIIQARKDK